MNYTRKLGNGLLFFIMAVVNNPAFGQVDSKKIADLQDYFVHDSLFVPNYIFDTLIGTYQKGLAGAEVKSGKATRSTLTVDDKGASVNVGAYYWDIRNWTIYLSAHAAGAGDKNFVSVFENGKYQQTVSVGGVVNIFPPWGGGSFFGCDKWLTRAKFGKLRDAYASNHPLNGWHLQEQNNFVNDTKLRGAAETYIAKMWDCDKDPKWDATTCDEIIVGEKFIDSLCALGLLPKGFYQLSPDDQQTALNNTEYTDFLGVKYIKESEKLFTNSDWQSFHLTWFTIAGNYNNEPQQLLDTTLSGKDHYVKKYYNEYFSGYVAYNYTHSNNFGSQFQITISPTFSFATPRAFDDANQVTITKQTSYTRTPNDTVSRTIFTSQGYEHIAERRFSWSIEAPITLLWNKSNFGIDVSARVGGNNPKGDNVGARLGFYIPVDVKDDMPVWIEPLIKVGNLFEHSNMNFLKENFSVGFNLSVGLKKFSPFKK